MRRLIDLSKSFIQRVNPRFAVGDIAQARRALRNVRYRDFREGFVVDANDAMGAVLSFEPA